MRKGRKKDPGELTVEEILSLAEQGYEFIVERGMLMQVPKTAERSQSR